MLTRFKAARQVLNLLAKRNCSIPHLPAEDYLKTAQTGDIILWRGKDWESRVIEAVTASPYSHATIVIMGSVTADDGKVYGVDGEPQLLQAHPDETHLEIIDGQSVKYTCGVVLSPLRSEMTRYCYDEDAPPMKGAAGAWDMRRIDWSTIDEQQKEEIVGKMKTFIGGALGLPFDSGVLLPINGWHMLAGHLGIPTSHKHGYYCSDLVTKTLQMGGLLGNEHQSTWFSPMELSSNAKHPDFKDDLLLGVTYGLEQRIDVPDWWRKVPLEKLNLL